MALRDVSETPALSVRQPWAELIISGRKTIEVRSWAHAYRGRLWVHVAQKSDANEENAFGFNHLPKGVYIGSVTLCATVPFDRERWEAWRPKHLDRGEYKPGFYAWLLDAPHHFQTMVFGPGQLNLFYPDRKTVMLLHNAEAGARKSVP